MCGIAGIVSADEHAEKFREPLDRMIECLHHRGPDARGTHLFEKCALGHARLSIVDIEEGHQPMLTPHGHVGITFNGEIYGYKDVRNTLSEYAFRTHSDTEVILALHEKHGIDFIEHLPGMFAFGLWDNDKGELICARDRFGEKPLFYAVGENGEFIFASEIKAIMASGLIQPVLNRMALQHYLQHLYVHPHLCIYDNIHVLPPAHMLRWREGRVEIKRFWTLPQTDRDITMDDAIDRLRELLSAAVRRQLIADVPVAAFLSGGLDSSTIVSLASEHASGLRTISYGFENDLNELPYAREVATKYGTDHVELVEQNVDIAELLETMSEIYDEPFADSSNIPTYLISRAARDHTKVALTGDGGDELFAGYSQWYADLYFAEQHKTTPAWRYYVLHAIAGMLEVFSYAAARRWHRRRDGLINRYLQGSICNIHRGQNTYLTEQQLVDIGWVASDPMPEIERTWSESGTVDDAMRMDIENYMPGDILVKTDRAAMANSLELRAPFLDVDLASFCISLPSRLKISEDDDKIILRKAFGDRWSRSIRARKKQGFGAPVERWLVLPGVQEMRTELLNDRQSSLFNLISYDRSRHVVARDDYGSWILLILALWLKQNGNVRIA